MIWRFDSAWLNHSSVNYKLACIGTNNSCSDLRVGCTIGSRLRGYAAASCEHVGIDYIRIALLVFGGRFYNITIFSPDLLFIIMSWVNSFAWHCAWGREGKMEWEKVYALYTHGLSQNIRWPIREVNFNCHLCNFLIALLHITRSYCTWLPRHLHVDGHFHSNFRFLVGVLRPGRDRLLHE